MAWSWQFSKISVERSNTIKSSALSDALCHEISRDKDSLRFNKKNKKQKKNTRSNISQTFNDEEFIKPTFERKSFMDFQFVKQ